MLSARLVFVESVRTSALITYKDMETVYAGFVKKKVSYRKSIRMYWSRVLR